MGWWVWWIPHSFPSSLFQSLNPNPPHQFLFEFFLLGYDHKILHNMFNGKDCYFLSASLVLYCKIRFETKVILLIDKDYYFYIHLIFIFGFTLEYLSQHFHLQIKHARNMLNWRDEIHVLFGNTIYEKKRKDLSQGLISV